MSTLAQIGQHTRNSRQIRRIRGDDWEVCDVKAAMCLSDRAELSATIPHKRCNRYDQAGAGSGRCGERLRQIQVKRGQVRKRIRTCGAA